MATTAQRIADLERQMAALRDEFGQAKSLLSAAWDAGYDAGRASITGARSRDRATSRALRGSHLRPVAS